MFWSKLIGQYRRGPCWWSGAWLLLFFGLMSCAVHPRVSVPPAGMPEEVLMTPARLATPPPPLNTLRAAIFSFKEPGYAPNTGSSSALALHRELEAAGIFREITLDLTVDVHSLPESRLLELARRGGYDLLILGELLTWFEGSHFEATRVVQEIRVLHVRRPRPEIWWRARAVEQARPIRSRDLIVVDVQGAQAPRARVLMERNARKFTNLLLAGG